MTSPDHPYVMHGTGCTCPDNPRGLSWAEAARDPDRIYVEDCGRMCVGFQERVHIDCPEHGKEWRHDHR